MLIFVLGLPPKQALGLDPKTLVNEAIEYWRDQTSYTEANMTIHRNDWERTMSLKAWTKGKDNTLVRFTAPPKDAGSASLTLGQSMWSYAPKINRVIKIPPSMMAQSWMGSDFSYNDLSKSSNIIDQYDHTLVSTDTIDGFKVYSIESIPHEDAPVVWGKETLKIRGDYIILEHNFFDQDMKLVKRFRAVEIAPLGGKIYARTIVMEQADNPEHWTRIVHTKARFGVNLPNVLFTLSNLRNPRE